MLSTADNEWSQKDVLGFKLALYKRIIIFIIIIALSAVHIRECKLGN